MSNGKKTTTSNRRSVKCQLSNTYNGALSLTPSHFKSNSDLYVCDKTSLLRARQTKALMTIRRERSKINLQAHLTEYTEKVAD